MKQKTNHLAEQLFSVWKHLTNAHNSEIIWYQEMKFLHTRRFEDYSRHNQANTIGAPEIKNKPLEWTSGFSSVWKYPTNYKGYPNQSDTFKMKTPVQPSGSFLVFATHTLLHVYEISKSRNDAYINKFHYHRISMSL